MDWLDKLISMSSMLIGMLPPALTGFGLYPLSPLYNPIKASVACSRPGHAVARSDVAAVASLAPFLRCHRRKKVASGRRSQSTRQIRLTVSRAVWVIALGHAAELSGPTQWGSPRTVFQNCSVVFICGNGVSGIDTSRKRHSGAQPSATSNTSSRSVGIAARAQRDRHDCISERTGGRDRAPA
jgi:hypothetical protein